jgi:hypothetical protein
MPLYWRFFGGKTYGIFDFSRMCRKVECISEMGSDILQRRKNRRSHPERQNVVHSGRNRETD